MPAPNESRGGLIKTTPSYIGCTLSKRSNNQRQLAANFPTAKNCSQRKVISLVPPIGSIINLNGGSK